MIKKLASAFLIGAFFAAGLATAQVMVRSIQFSQDNSGPIGVDATNNIYYQQGIHILSNTGTPPVVSACGTNTNVGTDFQGRITQTAGTPASCTLTFARTWGTAPNCVVAPANGILAALS